MSYQDIPVTVTHGIAVVHDEQVAGRIAECIRSVLSETECPHSLVFVESRECAKCGAIVPEPGARTPTTRNLADECGALRTERDDLLKENAVLRRKIERLERKR